MDEEIIRSAQQLLTTRGTQHFTMDELAQRLGISKKTLYRFVTSKLSVIERVCNRVGQQLDERLSASAKGRRNQIETLLGYVAAITSFIKTIDPAFAADLRRNYPSLSRKLTQSIGDSIGQRVQRVLEAGISEGIFRGNLHPALVVNLWQQHIECDFKYAAKLVNDYSKDEVFRQGMNLFLYGITSPAAVPQLELALREQALETLPQPFHQTNFS